MLEQSDLQAIAALISASEERTSQKIEGVEERMTQKIEGVEERMTQKIEGVEERMTQKIEDVEARLTHMVANVEKSLRETERMLLDEIERNRTYLEKCIQSLRERIDGLEQYYRITKLEHDNHVIKQKIIDDLSQRVTILEEKLA